MFSFHREIPSFCNPCLAEVLTPVCAPGAAYFGTIMWVYKGALNTFGVVMAAKTWNCADGVGEVRHTLGVFLGGLPLF